MTERRRRLGAVDTAIGSWGQGEPDRTASIFAVLSDSRIARAPGASARLFNDNPVLKESVEQARIDTSPVVNRHGC